MIPPNPILAIDLDGTLLHPEPAEISIWGRTRYQYLSLRSAQLLAEISQVMPIAVATARHAGTVKNFAEKLPNVNFCGFVVENGLVVKTQLITSSFMQGKWTDLIAQLPDWEIIGGYEKCLGLIPPPRIDGPQAILQGLLLQLGQSGEVHIDGRKVFVYPTPPDKAIGLKTLGFSRFMAAGNDLNDFAMLNEALYTVTLSSAHPQIKTLVASKQGYCSPFFSHQGTEDLLLHLYRRVIKTLHLFCGYHDTRRSC